MIYSMRDLEFPGRIPRTLDQDATCEHISTFATLMLTIPLGVVALAMLTVGDYLHVVYAAGVAFPAVGFIALAVIRERTVLPRPGTAKRREPATFK